MNKETKQRLDVHLSYYWIAYVAIAVALVLVWNWVFTALGENADNEKIGVFIAADYADTDSIEGIMIEQLQTYGIKEVNAFYYNPDNEMFYTIYSTRGVADADILILPESVVAASPYFAALTDEIIEQILPENKEYEFFVHENKNVGICIYDKDNPDGCALNGLIRYLDSEGGNAENFYLVFNPDSVNIGDLSQNNKVRPTDVSAFAAAKLLLQYGD